MSTKTACMIIGFVFIAVGILGFIPNPIIANSHEAIFHADAVHSSVHIVSGLLFVIFSLGAATYAATFMKVFGVIYFMIGILGLINAGTDGMARVLGFLHVNGADNILHIVLGVVIFAASMIRQPVVRS